MKHRQLRYGVHLLRRHDFISSFSFRTYFMLGLMQNAHMVQFKFRRILRDEWILFFYFSNVIISSSPSLFHPTIHPSTFAVFLCDLVRKSKSNRNAYTYNQRSDYLQFLSVYCDAKRRVSERAGRNLHRIFVRMVVVLPNGCGFFSAIQRFHYLFYEKKRIADAIWWKQIHILSISKHIKC